jgi:hypothetical protein
MTQADRSVLLDTPRHGTFLRQEPLSKQSTPDHEQATTTTQTLHERRPQPRNTLTNN